MDCVNHTGVTATAYCQNCGKALCAGCVRKAAGGQILCDPARRPGRAISNPLSPPPPADPNPAAAAVLGLIPGVGAMYNGQFFKGLIHVVDLRGAGQHHRSLRRSSASSLPPGSSTSHLRPITPPRRGATASRCPIRWG